MESVYLIGAYTTTFGKFPEKSLRDLCRDAYLGVLSDAGLERGAGIGFAYFSNCMMDYWGQNVTRSISGLGEVPLGHRGKQNAD